MTCPTCGSTNPDDADTCVACGSVLGEPCEVCGTLDTPDARFCRTCGSPRQTDPIGSRRDGGRRVVTALFADLVGSTAVAEQLDAEDWAELAEEALTGLSDCVERFGGTVVRLLGDGLLALFGAPEGHEDDAERAVRAGLDLVRAVPDLASRATARGARVDTDQLEVRVGVATGPVVVGTVGSDLSPEYTALGDAVNLAARLQSHADPGTVLMSDETQRSVEHAVVTEPLAPIEVRGKRSPVAVFRAVSVRLDRSSGRGLGADVGAVGRDAESAELDSIIDALAGGRGGVVLVFGEAGIGKSRLLADLKARTARRHPGIGWWEAASLSFEISQPYALARRVMDALGGRASVDLGLHLEALPERRSALVARTLESIDVAAGNGRVTPDAVALAFRELFDATLGDGASPGVLVIDDLHWADAASSDLVEAILGMVESHPLLLLCAGRLDRSSAAWRVKQTAEVEYPHRYREFRLAALTTVDARSLLSGILDNADLPDTLLRSIVDRAEGNPLFLEEIVRELIQLQALRRDGGTWRPSDDTEPIVGVPRTLRRLLQARVDRLPADARTVLETGAVIGRTFPQRLLERVVGRDAGREIHDLLKVGLVEESTPGTDRTLTFRHALVHDATYESILRRRRREIHQRVGEALEAEAHDQPGTAAMLAGHFIESGDGARASAYGLQAGDEAARMGAFREAHHHYDGALRAADDDTDAETVIRLLLGRGRSHEVLGDLDAALKDLDNALSSANASGRDDLVWKTLLALGALWAARDYRRTGTHYREALTAARVAGSDEMVATSLNRLGNWYVNASDPDQGIEMHTEALAIFESLGSEVGMTATHDLLGMAHMLSANREQAHLHMTEALRRFRDAGDQPGIAGALIGLATGSCNYEEIAEIPTSDPAQSLVLMDEALGIVTEIGFTAGAAFAHFMRGQILGCMGRLGEALAESATALELAESIGHDQWRVGALSTLGSVETDALDFDSAQAHLEDGLATAHSIASRNWVIQVSAALAYLFVERGDPEKAESVLDDVRPLGEGHRSLAQRACSLVAAMVAVERGDSESALATLAAIDGEPALDQPIAPAVALVRGQALALVDRSAAGPVLLQGLGVAQLRGMGPAAWRLHLALAALGGRDAAAHRTSADRILRFCAASLNDPEAEARMLHAARVVLDG